MSEVESIEARAVKVTFVNGDSRSFAFEPLSTDPAQTAELFNKITESGQLLLGTSDRIIYIPMNNVLSLEIVPKPEGELPNLVNVLHEFK